VLNDLRSKVEYLERQAVEHHKTMLHQKNENAVLTQENYDLADALKSMRTEMAKLEAFKQAIAETVEETEVLGEKRKSFAYCNGGPELVATYARNGQIVPSEANYMSPEQSDWGGAGLMIRSDVSGNVKPGLYYLIECEECGS